MWVKYWHIYCIVCLVVGCTACTCTITGKKGPIYEVEWNPNSEEFCVLYGCIL